MRTHLDLATALLAVLDLMDGDPDLEDTGDLEPSLGGYQINGEVDLELDNCDDESSLGWTRTGPDSNQAMIATEMAFDADLEADDSDFEDSVGVDTPEAPMTEWSEAYPIQIVPGPAL